MKKLKSFYPVLLVAFPILSLFGKNMDEVPIIDLVLPLLVAIAGILIILLLLRRFNKNHNKIALILSLFIVLFFSYGYIREAIFTEYRTFIPNVILLSIWLILFIVGIFLIIKAYRDFAVFTKFICIVTVVLIAISLGSIGIGSLNIGHEDISNESGDLALSSPENPPDIYYIIFDMYAREDNIKKVLDYDNSEFIDYLTSKEFYVATKSCSNYSTTFESLASSLNMDYRTIENLQAPHLERTKEVKNSKVSQLLKSVGYQYIYVAGGVVLDGMEKYAEVYPYSGVSGIRVTFFLQSLCETTVLAPIARYFGVLHGANQVLYAFDTLAEIPSIEKPTFCYSHIFCPHPPWLFDNDGIRTFILDEKDIANFKQGYLGNLCLVNKKVEALIDEILSKSSTPPIIILQGDHGFPWRSDTEILSRYIDSKYEILNAYYLPRKNNELLYETISPVNSFRVVFNLYFGTDYELLQDETISPFKGGS